MLKPRNGTLDALLGQTVYIWMSSDEWLTDIPAANVTMSNIRITSYWDEDGFILSPSATPATSPSITPSTSPTMFNEKSPGIFGFPVDENPATSSETTDFSTNTGMAAGLQELFDVAIPDKVLLILSILITALFTGCTCFCLGYFCSKTKQLQLEAFEEAEKKRLVNAKENAEMRARVASLAHL